MDYPQLSVEDLISLAMDDREAVGELARRYLPLVKSRVLFYYGVNEEFDDLMQEGYIGFLSAVSSYRADGGSSFGSFAKLCVDRALGNYGKSRVHREQSAALPLEEDYLMTSALPDRETVAREDWLELMKRAKSVLSELEYGVMCCYVSGYKPKEIAEMMAISPKSAENAIRRFKEKLKP